MTQPRERAKYSAIIDRPILPLPNGGAIGITVGQYYLPDGENLGAGGLRRGPRVTCSVGLLRMLLKL